MLNSNGSLHMCASYYQDLGHNKGQRQITNRFPLCGSNLGQPFTKQKVSRLIAQGWGIIQQIIYVMLKLKG